MGGYISYIPLVIIFASQGVWLLSQVNQRLGLAFLQQLPSGRRPDGVLPWAWRKNSSLPLKAWCLKQFSWACFTLKWRVKHKAWKKNKVETGLDNFNVHIYNYMYIYICLCCRAPLLLVLFLLGILHESKGALHPSRVLNLWPTEWLSILVI